MRTSWSIALPRACTLGALLCSLAAAGCTTLDEASPPAPDEDQLGTVESPVVYGTDNRMDVYAHPDASLRTRAQQATVALMSPSSFNTSNPNNVTFNASTLQQAENL